jgi:xylitol oxidase
MPRTQQEIIVLPLTNWARNVSFEPERFVRPSTIDELRELVATADRIRVLGTGHSFSELVVTDGVLISLANLPVVMAIDQAAATVRVSANVRFGELMRRLDEVGLALPNTASLPHISVVGACATATHGSGSANGCLSTGVVELELVGPDGASRTLRAGDPEFDGSVVAMGVLGVVTSLTLNVQPAYQLRQYVYDDMPFDTFVANFDEVLDSAYSVSAFTAWRRPVMDTVWRKQLLDAPPARETWFGARLAASARHPIPSMPTENTTEQLGVPGPWHERLPHFRLGFTPSSGDELQAEYLLPREHAPAALRAISAVREAIGAATQVSEVRTVAADELWLSPASGRPTVALHFTWVPDLSIAAPALAVVERALEPFEARPHWGKISAVDPRRVRALYPRMEDFDRLVRRHDPGAKFTNEFMHRYLRVR